MNEQLQAALADLINKSVEVAGNALAFAQEELPEVIQQLLVWKAVQSFMHMMIWVVMFYICIVMVRQISSLSKSEDYVSDEQYIWRGAVALLFGIACITVAGAPDWVQIWLAPKVYLLEYAANLAK